MDMRFREKHQARLDLVEGLKVLLLVGNANTQQEFDGWCAAEIRQKNSFVTVSSCRQHWGRIRFIRHRGGCNV